MKEIQERIGIDPEIRFGKPCIKGTRIAVVDILGWLASDMSIEDILKDFPPLSREDILAAMIFKRESNPLEREEAKKRLKESMHQLSEETKRNGLTEEKLAKILEEIDRERDQERTDQN